MRTDVLSLGFIGFVAVYEATVYAASMLPYIQSLVDTPDAASFYYSVIMSLTAFVQVIASIGSGFLARKTSMKTVFLHYQIICLFGTLSYALAEWPLNSVWAIIVGKSLAGVGSANIGLSLSYSSSLAHDRQERTALISNLRTVTIFATLPSSIVAIILAIPALQVDIGSYQLNAFTWPAWTSLLLQVLSIIFGMVTLRRIEDDVDPMAPKSTATATKGKAIYMSKGVALMFAIFFFNGFYLSSTMYALPVVMMEGYEWSIIQYAPVWVGISILGISCVQFAKLMGKYLGAYHYLIIVPNLGLLCILSVLMAVGSVGVAGIPRGVGAACFVIGGIVGFGSIQINQTTLSSIFSHGIPPEYIIRMMPLTSAMVAGGKILGPLVSEAEFNLVGMAMVFYFLLIITATLMFISIAINDHFQSIELRESLSRKNYSVSQDHPVDPPPTVTVTPAQPLLSEAARNLGPNRPV